MARSSPSGFARGYSPMPGEVRRSASASPLITPPRVELPSGLAGQGQPLGSSLASAVPAVPPLGTSLSDLRATVIAQQRQLDSLVDKVASLLSAMHAEVLEDVRKTCRHRPDNAVTPPIDTKDFAHLLDLREAEGGLRAWMQSQLREAWDRLEAKLREAQYHMSNEVRDVQGHVAGEVHSMRARISHLEDMTLDDDDDAAELRRHLEVRLEAQAAQVHSSMGQLAAELRQHVQASLEARPAGPSEHLAEDVLRRVDARLQEHEAKDGVLGKLRDELRQEAEVRLEAKMTQTFGLAQRLMNELRQEIQGQVVQVHDSAQHMAVDLRRGLEAQQLQLQASLQHLARDGAGRGGGSASVDASAAAAIEEQLAGCRAAAADCARSAIESAEATDHMEEQLKMFMQRLADHLREDLDGQQERVQKSLQEFAREELQKGLQELQRAAGQVNGSRGDAASDNPSVAELEEELANVQAALADSARAAREASAKTSSVEAGLKELSQRLPNELRQDCEAQEARLTKSLQEQVQEAVRKGLEAAQAKLSEAQAKLSEARAPGDAPAAVESALAAMEEELAKVKAEAASSTHSATEASAKARAVESSLEDLSKRFTEESLRRLVREEVQQENGSAGNACEAPAASEAPSAAVEEQLASCKAALADCTRSASEASAKADSMEMRFNELSERLTSERDVQAQEPRESEALQRLVAEEVQRGLGERGAGAEGGAEAEALEAAGQKHLAGCTKAAAECRQLAEEAAGKVEAAEARLKACGEELQAKLTEEGHRLADELRAARPAAADGAAVGEAAAGEAVGRVSWCPGMLVEYHSSSYDEWIECRITAVLPDGCLALEHADGSGVLKEAADPSHVRPHPSEEGKAPSLQELAIRLEEVEAEVGSHRGLLVALRDRVLAAEGDQDGDEGDQESSSAESGNLGTPGRGPGANRDSVQCDPQWGNSQGPGPSNARSLQGNSRGGFSQPEHSPRSASGSDISN